MARVAGIDIPNNKRVEIALTYIYGIGKHHAKYIVENAKINNSTRVKDLSDSELGNIRKIIEENFEVEGNLRKEVRLNIKRLQEIKCERGKRHLKGLPVRGQRTKTNARTRKGPMKLPIKGKKKVSK